MKLAAVLVAILAAISGAIAVFYWYKSSQIPIDPEWGSSEPTQPNLSTMGWVIGLMIAANRTAKLNKLAALWTAGSVGLSALSAILSAWPT